ncbi:MAG: hypothetical protein AAGC57_01425 [Pseudomonadota bacterium]
MCLPKRLARHWGGWSNKGVLLGPCARDDENSDYGHFVEPPETLVSEMPSVRLHAAGTDTVIQLNGHEPTVFRRSPQLLYSHWIESPDYMDATVRASAARLPVCDAPEAPRDRHGFANRDRVWVIFDGRISWGAGDYIGLSLPFGPVALTVSEVPFEPADPKRHVLALRFEGPEPCAATQGLAM